MEDISTGGCLCGAIRYQFSQAPLWAGYCHCDSCRRSTGAVVASFVGVSDANISFSGDDRTIYPSSPGVRRGFCAKCGTPLTYEADNYPNEVHLYIGTLHNPENFPPQSHVHCHQQVGWFEVADSLPRHDRGSTE